MPFATSGQVFFTDASCTSRIVAVQQACGGGAKPKYAGLTTYPNGTCAAPITRLYDVGGIVPAPAKWYYVGVDNNCADFGLPPANYSFYAAGPETPLGSFVASTVETDP
jgi:hypothetical protein